MELKVKSSREIISDLLRSVSSFKTRFPSKKLLSHHNSCLFYFQFHLFLCKYLVHCLLTNHVRQLHLLIEIMRNGNLQKTWVSIIVWNILSPIQRLNVCVRMLYKGIRNLADIQIKCLQYLNSKMKQLSHEGLMVAEGPWAAAVLPHASGLQHKNMFSGLCNMISSNFW